MTIAISPIHTANQFNFPLSLDEKIEIFIARVQGWQIQPALDMQSIPHSGFAQLHIIVSFFEMIGKYRAGYIGNYESAKYFKLGLRWTFNDIEEGETRLMDSFYSAIRNGLYHIGFTMPNVIIYDGIPKSFGFNADSNSLIISPTRFVDDIRIRFQVYANELQDQSNVSLRKAFEKRFDHDNGT